MIAFTLDPALTVQLVLAVLLPIAVGFVTTHITSAAKKAWLLAGLTVATSLATGLGDALATGGVFDVGRAMLLALPQFCISVAMHYGLWKPTGTAAAAQNTKRTTLVR